MSLPNRLPKQAKPVIRPSLIQPSTVLNFGYISSEEELDNIYSALENGANYNDPMSFSPLVAYDASNGLLYRPEYEENDW